MSSTATAQPGRGTRALERLRGFLTSGSGFDRAIAVAVGAIIACVWVLTLDRMRSERADATAKAMREATNLTTFAEEHALGAMEDVEQTLAMFVERYQRRGTTLTMQELFEHGATEKGLYRTFAAADARGSIVAASPTLPAFSVADRDFFEFHRQHAGAAPYIGKPVTGRATGQIVLPVTRRIDAADGSFAGVAIALLDPAYFTDFYRRIDVGPRGLITIAGLDGIARARRIGDAVEFGTDLRNTALFRMLPSRPTGTLSVPDLIDDVPRYVSYRTLDRYPLFIEVGLSEADVLSAFNDRKATYYAMAWAGSILLTLVGLGFVGAARRQQRAVADLWRTEARYRATFDQAAIGIVHVDPSGGFLRANQNFCAMAGYTETELRRFASPDGRADAMVPCILSGTDMTSALQQLAATPAGGPDCTEAEISFTRKDGAQRWAIRTLAPVRDGAGGIEYFIAVMQDITTRKQAEAALQQGNAQLGQLVEQLEYQAHHDGLTDLPNRVLCVDRLTQTIAQARRKGWQAGVLYLDLDRFKVVNDTLGHMLGDDLLRQTSRRLGGCVRAGDTVGRLGGDEFAVVLSEVGQARDAAVVAQKILEALAAPFDLDGNEVFVTASIGIAIYPGNGDDAAALLKNADVAMFSAKDLGRNNYQFYTSALNERALEKLQLESSLRRALERNEFVLHLQPKVSIPSGDIVGCEALLRWKVPGNGLVSPADFIPMLEESGLIVPVGEWVVRAACAQLRAWVDSGIGAVTIAVNLSPRQFRHQDVCDVVARALRDFAVDPALLEIEITESAAMHNADEAIVTLSALKALGVGIAIDDFGTGYSSLSYLKRFPVGSLKLDRSFVMDLPADADAAVIARAVIHLAHSLGLTVVAEGVETAEQLEFLAAYGCDFAQGYLLSRPIPAAQFAQLLAQERPLAAVVAGRGRRAAEPEMAGA